MSSAVDTKLSSETINVRFLRFSNMPRGDRAEVDSAEFMCLGHRWKVKIERNTIGNFGNNLTTEWLGVNLCSSEECSNTANTEAWLPFSLIVRRPGNRHYEETGNIRPGLKRGNHRYAKMQSIQKCLVDGNLVIEVTMWGAEPSSHVYVPHNPFTQKMLEVFMHEESSDVVIQVGGRGENDNKRAKTSPTIFPAHKILLRQGAPELFLMCRDTQHAVEINNIEPEIFRHLLYYIYGGTIEETDLKGNAHDIIDAADRFGVVSLKLEAEACYVQSTAITFDNFWDNLQDANSKNLALLREAVMDFASENIAEVRRRISQGDLPEAVNTELMEHQHTGSRRTVYDSLRVGELRHKLHERGLEVDGSRKVMITTLMDNDTVVLE